MSSKVLVPIMVEDGVAELSSAYLRKKQVSQVTACKQGRACYGVTDVMSFDY
jgi:hypothetical protein